MIAMRKRGCVWLTDEFYKNVSCVVCGRPASHKLESKIPHVHWKNWDSVESKGYPRDKEINTMCRKCLRSMFRGIGEEAVHTTSVQVALVENGCATDSYAEEFKIPLPKEKKPKITITGGKEGDEIKDAEFPELGSECPKGACLI